MVHLHASVIPAKAGTQIAGFEVGGAVWNWVPAFAGMTIQANYIREKISSARSIHRASMNSTLRTKPMPRWAGLL